MSEGYWRSITGENHGLNSQPGDIWVSHQLCPWCKKVIEGMEVMDEIDFEYRDNLMAEISRLHAEKKRLREGIEEHRAFSRNIMATKMYYEKDEKLYSLLKEEKGEGG